MSLYERLNELENQVNKLKKDNQELKKALDYYNSNTNKSEKLLNAIVELLKKNNEILSQSGSFIYSGNLSNDITKSKKNKEEEIYIPAIDISDMNLSGEEYEQENSTDE